MSDNTIRPLGEWLRQRREELGISLAKAETDTRIRGQYLEALEAESFHALPNPVVARGFLRNYAAYLGLDTGEAAGRYTAIAGEAPPPQPPDKIVPVTVDMFRPVPLHNLPGSRRRLRGLTFGLILLPVIAVLAWGWWNYPKVSAWVNRSLFGARPTATRALDDIGLATATRTPAAAKATAAAPTDTSIPAGQTPQATVQLSISPSPTRRPTATSSPTPPVYTGVFVELNFVAMSWVQVSVDGVRQFQGELESGARRSWYGVNRVDLRLGNAGGVEVTVNGQKLGTLGALGEVVDRTFEKAGAELTGTPPITATVGLSATVTLAPPALTRATLAPTAPPAVPTVPISPTTAISP